MASSRILPEFELLMPQSIKEAVDLLGKLKNKASIMAGGTDVVVSMTKGFGSPNVICLAEIPGLDYVEYDSKNGLRIGAMVRNSDLAWNAEVDAWSFEDQISQPYVLRNLGLRPAVLPGYYRDNQWLRVEASGKHL